MSDKSKSSPETDRGKPFQLRPSTLSSSFASSQSKSFVLRPSSLEAIADQIDKKATNDAKKRPADSLSDADASIDESSHDAKRVKDTETSGNDKLRLTEPLQRPTGIGTFGFDTVANSSASPNGSSTAGNSHSTNGTRKENYFLQTLNNRSSGFVFGQQGSVSSTGFNSLVSDKKTSSASSEDAANSADADQVTSTTTNAAASTAGGSADTLLKVAGEHMRKKDNKSSLHEIEVTDGEEGERNVLQIQCKVHIFDSDRKVWAERGRGSLKLNDICQSETQGVFQSRLVFRMQGSHSVVINTKLWPEMRCDKMNDKSVRLTGMDATGQDVIVFLVTTNKKDILQLHTAIDRRLIALQRNREQNQQQQQSASETTGQSDSAPDSRLADDEDSSSNGHPDTSLSEDNSREVEAPNEHLSDVDSTNREATTSSNSTGNTDD